jgi:alpha-tubulin suppressor-like RCC1 family protein
MGQQYTCAVVRGSMKCWGHNERGALGLGDTAPRGFLPDELQKLTPVDLGNERSIKLVAASNDHTCALLEDDSIKCWGANDSGQLGIGDQIDHGSGPNEMGNNLPSVSLGNGRTVKALSAGSAHSCAILDDTSLKCWGRNVYGQLGQYDHSYRGDGPNQMGDNLAPVVLGGTAKLVTAGRDATCIVLGDGSLKCLGDRKMGKLGLGMTPDHGLHAEAPGEMLPAINLGTGRTAELVAMGGDHTCALLDNGTIKCWGSNGSGELGLGDTVDRGLDLNGMGDNLPAVNLGSGRTAKLVVAGDLHTCALLDDASVKCWGDNTWGQLGQEDHVGRGSHPNEMGDGLPAVRMGSDGVPVLLAATADSTCALLDNDSLSCWGYHNQDPATHHPEAWVVAAANLCGGACK